MLCRACSTVLRISHPHITFTYGLYYYYYRLHATIHGINTSVYSDLITTGSFFHFLYESRTGDRLALYSSPMSFYFFYYFFLLQVSRLLDCGITCFIIRPPAHEAGNLADIISWYPFYLMGHVIYQAGLNGKGVFGIYGKLLSLASTPVALCTSHPCALSRQTMRLTFEIALLGVLSGISAINFIHLEERSSSLIPVSYLAFFLFHLISSPFP